jgi:hypothetical protein
LGLENSIFDLLDRLKVAIDASDESFDCLVAVWGSTDCRRDRLSWQPIPPTLSLDITCRTRSALMHPSGGIQIVVAAKGGRALNPTNSIPLFGSNEIFSSRNMKKPLKIRR